jgi:hypothetical protein
MGIDKTRIFAVSVSEANRNIHNQVSRVNKCFEVVDREPYAYKSYRELIDETYSMLKSITESVNFIRDIGDSLGIDTEDTDEETPHF